MRCGSLLVVSLVGAARIAAAQPSPPQPPPPPVDSTTGTTGTGPDTTTPTPPTPPTPPPPPPHVEHAADSEQYAPTELTFAIGVGYEFKTSLETPNIVSARVRFPSGLTL